MLGGTASFSGAVGLSFSLGFTPMGATVDTGVLLATDSVAEMVSELPAPACPSEMLKVFMLLLRMMSPGLASTDRETCVLMGTTPLTLVWNVCFYSVMTGDFRTDFVFSSSPTGAVATTATGTSGLETAEIL